MNRYRLFFMSLVAGCLPGAALACACCADPGTRFEDRTELNDWVISEIAAVKTVGEAQLYLTVCGLECVAGIDNPQTSYPAAMIVDATALNFRFGEAGTVRFEWPEDYTWFGVDTDLSDSDRSAKLYTEMRLRGTVTGTDAFAMEAPAPAELVLSGTGNICVGAASFQNWTLSVAGEGASYRLFGSLTRN